MTSVAILEGDTIQALTAAKSLKEKGYKTLLFYESKHSYGFNTKYADVKIKSPSISINEAGLHAFFLKYIKDNQVDAIIPMFDFSAEYLSRKKKELYKYTNFIIPNYDIFMRGYDKNQFMLFCQQNSFPHPATLFDLTTENAHEAQKITDFPAIIKPNITNGARGFKVVNSIKEIINSVSDTISAFGNCHIQEFIPHGGKQYLVGVYTKNDELINATVIDKMRYYPIKGGSSCFNQTIERNDLIELCYNIQKKLNWNGYAHYDLIEDPRDGSIKVMELNPRIQGCIKSSNIAGVDFIQNIIEDTLDFSLTKFNYRPGNYLRYFGLDFLWFLKSKNRFKTNPSWFKGFFSKKQYLQDGSLDDPKPFIYGTIGGFLKQLNPKFRATKKGMN